MNWQPIETAPKDGRQILVFDAMRQMIVVEFKTWPDGRAFWEVAHEENISTIAACPLTHWMPLPEPPESP